MQIHEDSLLVSVLGFDPKDQESPIILPEAEIYKIKYEDKYGRQLFIAGDWEKISRTLKKAGYKVKK
jgi:hypothetical protein